MYFDLGRRVMTRDGKRVGTVDQLVLDSETREVRAIIVHRGFLFYRGPDCRSCLGRGGRSRWDCLALALG